MPELNLYRLEIAKPYYLLVLKLQNRSAMWLIPAREHLDFRHQNRIAFETELSVPDGNNDLEIELNGQKANITLIEKSEIKIISENNNKLELRVLAYYDSVIHGDFVLMVPSWGRNTFRKIWVFIPV